MATQALPERVIPMFYFWERQRSSDPTERLSAVRGVIGNSHCAWRIGNDYFSAAPWVMPPLIKGASPGPRGSAYPLQKDRRWGDDHKDFGDSAHLFPLKGTVDVEKMQSLGRSIWRGNVQYRPQQFDNVIVAMLMLSAALPNHYGRQQDWFDHGVDPESYNWHWGYRLFSPGKFTSPSDVRNCVARYNRYIVDARLA